MRSFEVPGVEEILLSMRSETAMEIFKDDMKQFIFHQWKNFFEKANYYLKATARDLDQLKQSESCQQLPFRSQCC